MTWDGTTGSRMFREYLVTALGDRNTGDLGLLQSDIKAALFNSTVTPDKDATAALARYNAGTWLTANEVIDTAGSNWLAGGRSLGVGRTVTTPSVGTARFDAADTSGAGTLTIANAYGCLVYNNSVSGTNAKQGVCFNYFGGAQSVTGGTFTIVWSTNGIFEIQA